MTETHKMSRSPRVSVGIPVYNGQAFLAGTVESVLAQTFEDFELIISDNASRDRTEDICRSFAARDGRVRYYRSDTNRGAAWNHNRVFELSSGYYFKWQCDDDLCHPDFLKECIAVLDRVPSAVLCYPRFVCIDEDGSPVIAHNSPWPVIASSTVNGRASSHERFRSLIYRRDCGEEIYGLMRSSAARQTRLMWNDTQSDDNFLAELALRGWFCEVPKPLFFYRIHRQKSTQAYRSRLQRMTWFDPERASSIAIPFWSQFWEYLRLIWRAPLARRERLYCHLHMAGWVWKFRYWLGEDLRDALLLGTLVPFLKRRASWTRPIRHAINRIAG